MKTSAMLSVILSFVLLGIAITLGAWFLSNDVYQEFKILSKRLGYIEYAIEMLGGEFPDEDPDLYGAEQEDQSWPVEPEWPATIMSYDMPYGSVRYVMNEPGGRVFREAQGGS